MNCTVFHNNLEALKDGQLSDEIRLEMSMHVENCGACARSYAFMLTFDKIIEEEKSLTVNPFTSTRVMAAIDNLKVKPIPLYKQRLKPVLLAALIVLAILTGIMAGSLYKPVAQQVVPEELVFMNDTELEALTIVANE